VISELRVATTSSHQRTMSALALEAAGDEPRRGDASCAAR